MVLSLVDYVMVRKWGLVSDANVFDCTVAASYDCLVFPPPYLPLSGGLRPICYIFYELAVEPPDRGRQAGRTSAVT